MYLPLTFTLLAHKKFLIKKKSWVTKYGKDICESIMCKFSYPSESWKIKTLSWNMHSFQANVFLYRERCADAREEKDSNIFPGWEFV